MSGSVDLSGSLWDGVDVIDLSLLNNLYATGGSGTAWIEKLVSGAGLDVPIVTVSVLLPAAIWLLGSGLLGLGGRAPAQALTLSDVEVEKRRPRPPFLVVSPESLLCSWGCIYFQVLYE